MSWGHSNVWLRTAYCQQHVLESKIPQFQSRNFTNWELLAQGLKGNPQHLIKKSTPKPNHSKSYPVDSNVWETLIKKKANGHPKGLKHVSMVIFCSLRRVETWGLIWSRSSGLTWLMLWCCGFSTFSTSFCYRACCLERELRARVWHFCWERAGFCFGFYLLCWFIGFHPFHFDRYANLQIYHGKFKTTSQATCTCEIHCVALQGNE